MATIRQYFETDFSHTARVYLKAIGPDQSKVDTALLCDFVGNSAFLICFVPGVDRTLDFFLGLLEGLEYGRTELQFDGRIYLPSTYWFHGELRVENRNPLQIFARFFGEQDWISMSDLQASRRVCIYSEVQLSDEAVLQL